MNIYKEYQKLKLDKSYIGLEEGDTESEYFCTPIGAEVIGWESGGIHYCFINGFNETVFAVNPNGSIDDNAILPKQQEVLNNLQEKLDYYFFY